MRQETLQLREIAAIRNLQRQVAEAAAARASKQCRDAEAKLETCKMARQDTEESWRNGLSSEVLPLEFIRLWSWKFDRQSEDVARAKQDVERAYQLRDRTKAAWQTSVTQSGRAEETASRAFDVELEAFDNAAVQDAIDRHAGLKRVTT
jgi:hypothetical protein